nr:cysteine dioxygenase [Quercus suber]
MWLVLERPAINRTKEGRYGSSTTPIVSLFRYSLDLLPPHTSSNRYRRKPGLWIFRLVPSCFPLPDCIAPHIKGFSENSLHCGRMAVIASEACPMPSELVHTSIDQSSAHTGSPHDSTRNTPEPIDGFHRLISDINSILGPCNGIDSVGVDVEEIKKVMSDYTSKERDWERYAFADTSRAYTRNLVDRGNGKSNLVWACCSQITDHESPSLTFAVARPCLDSRQSQSNPRPCECSLRDEGPLRQSD